MLEGKLLPMLYVSDVPRSVAFYRDVIGFDFRGLRDEASKSSWSFSHVL
jgi:catechol 2,3-dioxygenase-like lactoylglutathione lyase family enzyme